MRTLKVYKPITDFNSTSQDLLFVDDRGFRYKQRNTYNILISKWYSGMAVNEYVFELIDTLEFKTYKELRAYIIYRSCIDFKSRREDTRCLEACKILSKNIPELFL